MQCDVLFVLGAFACCCVYVYCGMLAFVRHFGFCFFFFKQKTAYEMRISDWSSDVCSSDLVLARNRRVNDKARRRLDRCPVRRFASDRWCRCWQARSSRSCDELLYSVGSAVRRMRTWCG